MATFISRKKEARFVMRPTDRVIDEQRRTIVLRGKTAEFLNYTLHTEDPEMIDFLRHHPARGIEFNEIDGRPDEVRNAKKWISQKGIVPMITGSSDSSAREIAKPEVQPETRPETTSAISPELVTFINTTLDTKISAALGEIMSLLKADTVKEEKVAEEKPLKTFKCPYCGDAFPSGFAVGTHKKTCAKKS